MARKEMRNVNLLLNAATGNLLWSGLLAAPIQYLPQSSYIRPGPQKIKGLKQSGFAAVIFPDQKIDAGKIVHRVF